MAMYFSPNFEVIKIFNCLKTWVRDAAHQGLPSMFKGLIPSTKTSKVTQILDCTKMHYAEKCMHYV